MIFFIEEHIVNYFFGPIWRLKRSYKGFLAISYEKDVLLTAFLLQKWPNNFNEDTFKWKLWQEEI